jgi:prefoldin subunit 5
MEIAKMIKIKSKMIMKIGSPIYMKKKSITIRYVAERIEA